MKKIISVCLIICCIIFCCAGCSKEDDDKIALSTSNVNDYLTFAVTSTGTYVSSGSSYYDGVKSAVTVKPANTNFIYYNVVVEILVYGVAKPKSGSTYNYSHTLYVSLNSGGYGTDSEYTYFSTSTTGFYYASSVKGSGYVVKSVSGSIEKA